DVAGAPGTGARGAVGGHRLCGAGGVRGEEVRDDSASGVHKLMGYCKVAYEKQEPKKSAPWEPSKLQTCSILASSAPLDGMTKQCSGGFTDGEELKNSQFVSVRSTAL